MTQAPMMTPAVNTATGGLPSSVGNQSGANLWVDLDRQIQDLERKKTTPQIDTSKWFGNIWQSFANITQPWITPWVQNLSKDTKFKENLWYEKQIGITKDAFDSVQELSPYEMEAMEQKKSEWYSKEEFIASVARRRKEIQDLESGLWEWFNIFKEDAYNEGIKEDTKEYYNALKIVSWEANKSPYIDPTFKWQSFMNLSDEQKKMVDDEPYLEWPIRFLNTIKAAGTFVWNLPSAAINLWIFVSEIINNPKETISDLGKIPDAIHDFTYNFQLKHWWKSAAEQALTLVDETSKFIQENPDIVLAPEEMLFKWKLIKSLWKLAPDIDALKTSGIIGDAGKVAESEAGTIARLDSKTTDLINKWIKPTVAWKQSAGDLVKFQENVVKGVDTIIKNEDNLKLVDEFGEVVEWNPKNLQQYSDAIDQTKRTVYKQYNDLAKQAWEVIEIDIKNIWDELAKVISDKTIDISNPWLKKYAIEMQETIRKIEKLWVEEAQTLTQQLNAKLKAFYRNPNMNDIGKNLIDNMINNNLKTSLDNWISSVAWDGRYAWLKSQYAELAAVEKEVAKRALVEARKANKWLIDFTDVFSAGDVIAWVAWWAPAMVAKWLTQKAIAARFKRLNSPDRSIKKLFERVQAWKVDIDAIRGNVKAVDNKVPPTTPKKWLAGLDNKKSIADKTITDTKVAKNSKELQAAVDDVIAPEPMAVPKELPERFQKAQNQINKDVWLWGLWKKTNTNLTDDVYKKELSSLDKATEYWDTMDSQGGLKSLTKKAADWPEATIDTIAKKYWFEPEYAPKKESFIEKLNNISEANPKIDKSVISKDLVEYLGAQIKLKNSNKWLGGLWKTKDVKMTQLKATLKSDWFKTDSWLAWLGKKKAWTKKTMKEKLNKDVSNMSEKEFWKYFETELKGDFTKANNKLKAAWNEIADKLGGYFALWPMKTPERILQKAARKWKLNKLNDPIRGTVVVDSFKKWDIKKAFKDISWDLEFRLSSKGLDWYKDIKVDTFIDWVPAEIQVNTKPMLFAKEGELAVPHLLSKTDYSDLKKLYKSEGWEWHALMVEKQKVMAAEGLSRNAQDIAKTSRKYYKPYYDSPDLKKIINESQNVVDNIIKDWGITYNTKTLKSIAWEPYVAVSPYPKKWLIVDVDKLNEKVLASYIRKNSKVLLKKWHNLWWWIEDGKAYIDVSINLPKSKIAEAKNLWKKYNQKAIFDLETFDEIDTFWNWKPIDIPDAEIWNDIKDIVQ